ncbi:putative Protein HHL1, chloroplastic [Nannochloris sp. 'desiccata']|nr:putative Protein HHL1, chloroplastic [Chlorella desiccata (nom. nud.)]
MNARCSTKSSSAFVAARPVAAGRASVAPVTSRPRLLVEAAKGKQRMRNSGSKLANSGMPDIPTPPVDPDNVEFVIFVRSAKLLQWMPLSVMKGGAAANLLVKSLENDLGKKLYGNTLIDNIGQAIYKDKDDIERTIKAQFPMFKATKEFEFGFKIRDKENPKQWYMPIDVQLIPPQSELGTSPLDKATDFFSNMGENLSKSLGI